MTLETYDNVRETWRYYHDAYLGGRAWQCPSATTIGDVTLRWQTIDSEGNPTWHVGRERSYLVAHEGESDTRFHARRDLSAYVNACGPIVKAYAEGCTSKVTREVDAISSYLDDVDRRGSTWAETAESVAAWAAVYGVVATVVDTPSVDVTGLSEAQRAARGIQPYVVTVHPPAWAWVECDDGRVVEFAYVSTPYQSDLSTNTRVKIQLRVWRADRVVDGERVPGGWEILEGSVTGAQLASIAAQRGSLRPIAQGPLPAVLGGEIPVTFAYYERDAASDCPHGHSLIADAAGVSRLIYNTLSWITEIDRLAAFPFLAIPLASTGGQLDQGTSAKVGPGQGLGFNSASGSPSWVEPSGASQQGMLARCGTYLQFAFRSAGMELAADTSAQAQSGEALRIRSRDFESRALRFARTLQRWELATLRLFARLAGADPSGISVAYAKRITLPDPSEDFTRALTLVTAPIEIGVEARALAVVAAIDAALSLSEEQLAKVTDEVRAIFGGDLATATAEQTVKRLRNEREATGLQEMTTEPVSAPVPAAVEAPAVEAVADTALNGAQTGSLLSIINAIEPGAPMPIDTARAVIAAAFPTFDAARIEAMLAPFRNRPAAAPQAPAVTPTVVDNGTANDGG